MHNKSMAYSYKPCNPNALTWDEIRRFSFRQGVDHKIVRKLLDDTLKVIASNGPEFACARLKEVANVLRAYYASGYDKSVIQTRIVKKTSAGHLCGIYGVLQHLCHNDQDFIRVMNLLKMSSAFMGGDTPTPTQINKFLEAVRTTKELTTPKAYTERLVKAARKLPRRKFPKAGPIITSKELKDSHDGRMLSEWMAWQRSDEGLALMNPGSWLMEFVTGPENLLSLMGFRGMYRMNEQQLIGNIYVTQEPGYKLRCFAAPMIWTQQCLEPLKKHLMSLLKEVPWDMTHDQRYADSIILKHLRKGQQVHCYDLSNASDLIPFDSQEAILRQIVPFSKVHYIELFKYVSKGNWLFSPTGEIVSWHRGQPLGSGPSFGSFALWHGLLLFSLNGDKHNNAFFIVGDDVVILDDNLSVAYEQALRDIDLDWSPLKTMHSNRCAEFTGKLITPAGIFSCPKWKKFTSDNFIDNLFNNGPRFFDFVKPQYRPLVEAVAALPSPWGIGHNPKGLSLDARINDAYHLLVKEEAELGLDIDPRSRVSKRLAALTDWESMCFFPVASSRRFQETIEASQKEAQENALNFLSDERRALVLPGLANLQGLLLEELNAQIHTQAVPPVPHSRPQDKIIKRGLNRKFPAFSTFIKKWKTLLDNQVGTILKET